MWIGDADQRCLPGRFGLPLEGQTPISLSQTRFRKGRRDFARISIMETEGKVSPGMLRWMASGLFRTQLSTCARELQLPENRCRIVGGQLATLTSQLRPGAFVARLACLGPLTRGLLGTMLAPLLYGVASDPAGRREPRITWWRF